MKFMVEFQIKPGGLSQAIEQFETLGPSHHPGVTFRGAWVGSHSDVAFTLVESETLELAKKAAEDWSKSGEYRITPVIDIEQF
jgi:hypothetical protein